MKKADASDTSAARGPMTKTARGAMFEAVARTYLLRHGLREVARNARAAGAEIDLIMREPCGTLVFVEVRARRSLQYGGAAASVNWHKRQHLRRAAMVWLMRWRGPVPACRFDVLAIERNNINWIRDAFHYQD